MSLKNTRKNSNRISSLKENELAHTGVGKVLLKDNRRLMAETESLKKSLKNIQDELEELRSKNHILDKENGILNYRLTSAFFPELFKFISSSIGTGFAVSFFFNGQIKFAIASLVISIVVYGAILILYRK